MNQNRTDGSATHLLREVLNGMPVSALQELTLDALLQQLAQCLQCDLALLDAEQTLLAMTGKEWIPMLSSKSSGQHDLPPFAPTASCFAVPLSLRLQNQTGGWLLVHVKRKEAQNAWLAQACDILELFSYLMPTSSMQNVEEQILRAVIDGEPVRKDLAVSLHFSLSYVTMLWTLNCPNADKAHKIRELLRTFAHENNQRFFSCRFDSLHVMLLYGPEPLVLSVDSIRAPLDELLDGCCLAYWRVVDKRSISDIFELMRQAQAYLPSAYPLQRVFSQHNVLLVMHSLGVCGNRPLYEAQQQLLQTLLDHDRLHNSKYVDTLSSFLLDAHGDLSGACKLLYIHPNTLKYRLSKIGQLLGHSVRNTSDPLLYLSLLQHRLKNETPNE